MGRESSDVDLPPPPNLPPLPPPPFPPLPPGGGVVGKKRPVWPWVVGGAMVLFGLLALLAVIGFAARGVMQGRQRAREAMKQVQRVREENDAEQRRAVESGDSGVAGASDRLARAGSALGDAARQVDGDERKVLEAGQRIAAGLQPRLRAYESAFAALQKAGLFEPKTLTSRDQIAARRELLRALNTANEDLAANYAGMPAGFRAELRAAGIPTSRSEIEAQAFEGAAHIPDQLQLRDQDRQMARAGDELLDLLGREWGQWNVEKDGRVLFQKGDTLKRFQAINQRLVSTGQAQTELQRRMLDRATAPAAPTPR